MAPGLVIGVDIGEKCWGRESDCLVESRKESGKTVSADPDRQKWGKRGTGQIRHIFLSPYTHSDVDTSGRSLAVTETRICDDVIRSSSPSFDMHTWHYCPDL
ncbi:hypothetical protein N7512_003998 [Penicillium capsulatum]|nr:hypothetical protein N7512_003998 [Penicillium capsulatum]